jgi:putative hydrolase of the HAD superfamily
VEKVVLWDFDGTLAYRENLWRGALVDALDREEPGHGVTAEAFKPYLRNRFPWHEPERPHPELSTPEAWWARIEPVLADAFAAVGFPPPRSAQLARAARQVYADPAGYRLFDDSRPVLERLAGEGWRHVILSNHVPELSDIVQGVGLGDLVAEVLTSAATGYEKPHPEAFAVALRAAGHPRRVVMVGDNPEADVRGAEAAGIPAILVRSPPGRGRGLVDAAEEILSGT